MADLARNSQKEPSCASVEIYDKRCLGSGTYGKVFRAKFGQQSCVAKFLHDSLFQFNNIGPKDITKKFEEESKFLNSLKHPHLVQYLGIIKDTKSGSLVLLMEQINENLTHFLKQSNSLLPHLTQIELCYNISLALAYLHSIGITHRNLSSNNVLVSQGNTAKVTDYGISQLLDINPATALSTQYPRTSAYMPPEVLITPPHYSEKFDSFSLGVLAIQIATKQAPNPGPSSVFLEDDKYPNGRILALVPEAERRKTDIEKVDPNNPLLPIALECVKDRETERLLVKEICKRLVALLNVEKNVDETEITTNQQLTEHEVGESKVEDIIEKMRELSQKLSEKDNVIASKDSSIKEMNDTIKEKMAKIANLEKIIQVKDKCITDLQQKLQTKGQEEIPPVTKQIEHEKENGASNATRKQVARKPPQSPSQTIWKTGQPAPEIIDAHHGSVVVNDNRAYFSFMKSIYVYTLSTNKWIILPECIKSCFGLAFVHEQLVAIGGLTGGGNDWEMTNTLLGLTPTKSWDDILPPMSTQRANPAAITTATHLIVAGGKISPPHVQEGGLNTVEIIDLNDLQWTTVSSLPIAINFPQMVLCDNQLFIIGTDTNAVYSCYSTDLIKSSHLKPKLSPAVQQKRFPTVPPKPNTAKGLPPKPPMKPPTDKNETLWKGIADLPQSGGVAIVALGDYVLAIGGHNRVYNPNGDISYYKKETNSWKVIGQLPSPRWNALATLLHGNRLVVVGGNLSVSESCESTDLGRLNVDILSIKNQVAVM